MPTARKRWPRLLRSLDDQPLGDRVNIFLARLCFRGIYFPMLGKLAWLKVIAENRKTIFMLVTEAIFGRKIRRRPARLRARAKNPKP